MFSNTDDISAEAQHRMLLEQIAMQHVAAHVSMSPHKAKEIGEAARTAIDALLGVNSET